MKLSTRTGLLVICTVLGSAVQLEATHLSGRVQQDQQGISLLQLLMYIIDYSVSVKCPWDLISYPVGNFGWHENIVHPQGLAMNISVMWGAFTA